MCECDLSMSAAFSKNRCCHRLFAQSKNIIISHHLLYSCLKSLSKLFLKLFVQLKKWRSIVISVVYLLIICIFVHAGIVQEPVNFRAKRAEFSSPRRHFCCAMRGREI